MHYPAAGPVVLLTLTRLLLLGTGLVDLLAFTNNAGDRQEKHMNKEQNHKIQKSCNTPARFAILGKLGRKSKILPVCAQLPVLVFRNSPKLNPKSISAPVCTLRNQGGGGRNRGAPPGSGAPPLDSGETPQSLPIRRVVTRTEDGLPPPILPAVPPIAAPDLLTQVLHHKGLRQHAISDARLLDGARVM